MPGDHNDKQEFELSLHHPTSEDSTSEEEMSEAPRYEFCLFDPYIGGYNLC